MPDPDFIAGRQIVDDFAHRLDGRIRDVAFRGGFSDVYRSQDLDMRRRAEADLHPVFTIIVADMLMQFLSYHDRETFRRTTKRHARFPREW